jgi:hypothetical protein
VRGIYLTDSLITVLRDEILFVSNFPIYQLARHRLQRGHSPSVCHSVNETCVYCREEMCEDYSCFPNAVFVILCPSLLLILTVLMLVDERLLLGSLSPEIYAESN